MMRRVYRNVRVVFDIELGMDPFEKVCKSREIMFGLAQLIC